MIASEINKILDIMEEKVIGKVNVRVSSYDVLYIQIITPNLPAWNWYLDDISNVIDQGTTLNYICDRCITAYKIFILAQYLKKQ
jgi:hypothetical protein